MRKCLNCPKKISAKFLWCSIKCKEEFHEKYWSCKAVMLRHKSIVEDLSVK